jgi:hypothetical protein
MEEREVPSAAGTIYVIAFRRRVRGHLTFLSDGGSTAFFEGDFVLYTMLRQKNGCVSRREKWDLNIYT